MTTTEPPIRSSICPWFEDGNIVLQAENTLFRVHRGVLSLHSSVFRDMFALPQSLEDATGERVEGCVVVHLHDKPDEVGYMINALYRPNSAGGDNADQLQFDFVAGILRLGTKYMIGDLRKYAIATLTRAYPTSLEAFDEEKYTPIRAGQNFHPHTTLLVVQLLAEHLVVSPMPAALYSLCRERFETLVEYSGAPQRLLSFENLQVAVKGKARLVSDYSSMLDAALCCGESEYCGVGCDGMMRAARAELNKSLILSSDALNPGEDQYHDLDGFGICDECRKACVERHEEMRKGVWARLPEVFDLPDWKSLLASDAGSC